jgi:hypothetical protein
VDDASMTNHANYPKEPVSQIVMHTPQGETWKPPKAPGPSLTSSGWMDNGNTVQLGQCRQSWQSKVRMTKWLKWNG